MKGIELIISIFVIFSVLSNTTAQDYKSVLGLPEKFEKVVDLRGSEMDEFMNGATGPKSKNKPWRVICDRDGLETYSDGRGSGRSGKKLKFRDWYYVLEERNQYIHLGKMNGEPDNNLNIMRGSFVESFGWIEKSKMLLWTIGLRNENTGISLKSLILYTAEGAKKVINNPDQAIKIYKGPGTVWGESAAVALYEYYFILKKENGHYLISKDSDLLNFNNIAGWVSANDQADWNTRLALEPNFNQDAFNERKMRVNYQFVAFTDEVSASNHSKTGKGNESRIITRDDPVNAQRQVLGTRNPRRYIGNKLRMPVLRDGGDFYATGVLGSVGEETQNECPECEKALDEIINRKDNYNILFMVEATTGMRQFKSRLIEAIESMKRDLTGGFNQRFAIAFYRNANMNGDSYLDITPMTTDIEVLKKKIESAVFTDDSFDGYSSLYNALSKSVSRVGFQANATNIVYIIGQNPDFRENPTLKVQCIKNGCSSWITSSDLAEQLSNIRAHIVHLQTTTTQGANDPLSEQVIDLMLEVSKGNHRQYRKIFQLTKQADINPYPVTARGRETSSYIGGGSTSNVIYFPGSSNTMTESEFASNIRSPFREIRNKLNEVYEFLENIMTNPQLPEVPGDGFEKGALFDLLSEVLKRSGMEPTEQNLKKILERKIPLYVRAYVPKRIPGAQHNLCSQVLFFPERELADYMNDLRSMVALKNQPEFELRTGLKNVMLSIYNKYSGNKKIDRNLTVKEFFAALHGEGFNIENSKHDFAVNRIDSQRGVTVNQLREFLEDLQKTYENLELLTKDNSYEFKFVTRGRLGQNTYYWIPIEETF
jgi:hypothetical protein